MNRSSALDTLRRVRPALERRGIAHAALFGSVARGDSADHSDIDVLIEPVDGKRLDLFSLGSIQTVLEEAFGTDVDVVVAPVKNSRLSVAIQQDRADAF